MKKKKIVFFEVIYKMLDLVFYEEFDVNLVVIFVNGKFVVWEVYKVLD